MKHTLLLLAAALSAGSVFANAWDGVLLKGRTDKANPVGYRAGEKIVFTVTSSEVPDDLDATGCVVAWERTGDDGKVERGSAPFRKGDICSVATSLDRPGFVRLVATVRNAAGKDVLRDKTAPGAPGWQQWMKTVFFDGGAGVDVDKITQSVPEPKDFDAWWAAQKKLLATVPPKATRKEVKRANGCVIYALSVDCFGPRPVTGYLFIPENAAPKSCKARCAFQGYGFHKQSCPEWATWSCAKGKEIFLEINAHGYELDREKAYYDEFAKKIVDGKYSYAFSPAQNAKPETAYFRFMAMRVMRALEYVKSLPEWNGRDLVAEGGSQGGLQTSWAAGLDPDVTLARPSITWGCDYGATEPGRRLHGPWFIKYAPGLDYFDSVNHIKRAKCPVEVTRAGLGDYTCPPSGLAAYYNAIPTAKSILWVQGSQHGLVPPGPNQKITIGNHRQTGGESKSESASTDVK